MRIDRPPKGCSYLEARRRAEKLLKRFLSDEQREYFEQHGSFYVRVDGRVFLIESLDNFNIIEFNPLTGRELYRYCLDALAVMRPPLEDIMLSQKMLLETNPSLLDDIAVKGPPCR